MLYYIELHCFQERIDYIELLLLVMKNSEYPDDYRRPDITAALNQIEFVEEEENAAEMAVVREIRDLLK